MLGLKSIIILLSMPTMSYIRFYGITISLNMQTDSGTYPKL